MKSEMLNGNIKLLKTMYINEKTQIYILQGWKYFEELSKIEIIHKHF